MFFKFNIGFSVRISLGLGVLLEIVIDSLIDYEGKKKIDKLRFVG